MDINHYLATIKPNLSDPKKFLLWRLKSSYLTDYAILRPHASSSPTYYQLPAEQKNDDDNVDDKVDKSMGFR